MSLDAGRIAKYLHEEARHPVRVAELARALRVRPAERRPFRRLLRQLVARGEIVRLRGGRYAAPARIHIVTGTLRTWRRGNGVVTADDGTELFIPSSAFGSAMDGDRVAARPEGRSRGGRAEGRIVRILKRGRTTVVGRVHSPLRRGGVARVVPEDLALIRDVTVPILPEEVRSGDMVVVRITDWGDDHRSPIGEVERVLGAADAPGVDVLAIIHGHELPTAFPPDLEAQAERIRDRGIRRADLQGRVDWREKLTFTIDPADAKDHDDALSIEAVSADRWEVGVHIADVSFYVRAGGALDREARKRGTSVYLVDRALPMLPAALSSDICSLVPGADRLTLSLFVTIDAAGSIMETRFSQAVIRSRHKLSYEQAQAVLDGNASIDAESDAALFALRDVARWLRAARRARGSLDFDLPETRVFLDASGVPVDIQRAERWESHRLVEDLMLMANEIIGLRATREGYPFVYRIHETPDALRMAQLATMARALGFQPGFRERPTPAELQRLLAQKNGTPEALLLASLTLRSMKQARYSEADRGHFGLATRHYTHFTSPIRRYPDLLVHRIVAARHLGRGRADRYDMERLHALASHASDRERVASAAERNSVELKKMRFMEQHLGATFDGTVSDVRSFGFFVLLDPYYVEGLVRVSTLEDDYYSWSEERFLLIGEHTGRRFKVGQRVRVQIANVDIEERRIDFVLAEEGDRKGRKRARRGRTR
jgi:ribonuclease R